MMKKIYVFLISTLGLNCNIQAQQQFQGINFGDMPSPVPSLSSLATRNDSPSSLAMGIQDISIPIITISGYGGTECGVELNYNPLNVSLDFPAGEVGSGWFMSKGGVISRQINGTIDEAFQNETSPHYEKNVFDDEFYYSLPGLTGKFKIERNIEQNTFRIIDLTPLNNIKITYSKQTNPATLVIQSFTITDDKGNSYYFSDYSTAVVFDSLYEAKGLWGFEYKSAFYLTSIKNSNGIETANFTYHKTTKSDENNTLLYKTCHLQYINTASGNIEIVYDYDQNLEQTMNDPYSIKKVILNNSYSKVSEYSFEYSYPFAQDNTKKRRQLDKIKKMKGQNILEETLFLYNSPSAESETRLFCEGSSIISPPNILNRIISPNKGVTQYVYESSEIYSDKNSAAYIESLEQDYSDPCIQYKNNFLNFEFDTSQTSTYSFNISGNPSKKKVFWVNYSDYYTSIDPDTGMPILLPPVPENKRITYTLKRGSEILATNKKESGLRFYNYPGQYTVEVTVPYINGQVNFDLQEVLAKPGPYRNALPGGEKFRLHSIKEYNDINSNIPLKTVSYNYDDFTVTNASSGYNSIDGNIQFKNVKVVEGTGNGYTRYYYKIQKDYPYYVIPKNGSTATFQPYYNLLKAGILEKKEVYNESDQLLSQENYEYTFGTADDEDYLVDGVYYSKTAFVSQSRINSKVYPSGSASSFLESISENNVRADNFKPSSSKNISPDGTVTESFYKYPQDKNLTSLVLANMTGIQVESEVKKNGKAMGKAETKFDNSSYKYPTSSIEINPNDTSVNKSITYDAYDDKGNILQYTTEIDPITGKGNSTTLIWGYNKTLPIAKITGAKLEDLGTLADNIVTKSNNDINATTENELLIALDLFRNHPTLKKFPIITHTYDPLIGMTSTTPANGLREFYKYDNSGRLQAVIDVNGNIVKEVKYNNKQ